MECQICFAQESFQAPCCFSYCFDCLIKWMEHYADITKCPNQNCLNILTPDILEQMITDKQQKIQYHEVLLRKYLLKDQNTRACPSKCNYYGFIDPNQRCDKKIECMKCGYTWTEYSILSYRKKEEIEINNFVINSANALFDFWYTQECIVCNSKIQKNGGCPNMTCSICKTIFCWICKQNCSINHKQEICSLQISIKIALSFYGLFTLINTFGYDSYFGLIFYYIGYFALANISIILLVISVLYGLKIHQDIFFGRISTTRMVKDYMLFTAALVGFFIVNFLMVDQFEKSFIQAILFVFMEVSIFAGVQLSIQASSYHKYWKILLTIFSLILGCRCLGHHYVSIFVFVITEISNLKSKPVSKDAIMVLHFQTYLLLDVSFKYLIIIFIFDVTYSYSSRMDRLLIILFLIQYFIFNLFRYYLIDSNDKQVKGLVDNPNSSTIDTIMWILKLPLSLIL